MQESQLDMYIKNQNELLKKYNGKLIAVSNGNFLGEYPNELVAYRDMVKRGIKEGDFMIVKCTPGDGAYTSYFANWFPIETEDAVHA